MIREGLALVNADIVTMDPARPRAEAALVLDGRIRAVGSDAEIRAAAAAWPGPVATFDAGGRAAVPGFIDGHAHFEMTCLALTKCLALHVPPYESLADIADGVRQAAAGAPPGEWIVGRTSFRLYAWVPEKRLLTRQELDAVTTEHPVVVLSSLHIAMLNTAALKALGLWGDGPNIRPGTIVHRDADGLPTGVVTEVWDLLPAFPEEVVKGAIRERMRDLFLANGVTSIHNLPYSAEDVRAVAALQAAGELPLRLRFWVHVPHQMSLDEVRGLGILPGFGDERLRYGGVKIFVDGIGMDAYGNLLDDTKWTREALTEFVCTAHSAGQQLWMHIASPAAARLTLDAIEEAMRRDPRPHRHRIEHSADHVRLPEDIARFRELGVGMVTTPQFLFAVGDTLMGNPNARRYALRSIIDGGIGPIGCSDTTGSVPEGIAPLFNMACAVNRRTRSGRLYWPEEAITPEEALKLFTVWPAYWGFEEHEKGAVRPGLLGDFAVLSANPLTVDPDNLGDVRVEATIIGGEVVWQR